MLQQKSTHFDRKVLNYYGLGILGHFGAKNITEEKSAKLIKISELF